MADIYTAQARKLITDKLMQDTDEGVRVITAMFGVPNEAVQRVAAKLRAEAAALAALPEDQVDTGDIPEVTDWSGAERGRFTASAIEARSDATGTDAAEGESADPKGDAQ